MMIYDRLFLLDAVEHYKDRTETATKPLAAFLLGEKNYVDNVLHWLRSELLKRCTVRIAKRWMDTSSLLLISNAPADQVPGTSLKTNPVSVSRFWTNPAVSSLSKNCPTYWEQEPGPWWKRVPGGRSTDWSREAGRNFALPGAETGVGSWRQGVGGLGTEQIGLQHGWHG